MSKFRILVCEDDSSDQLDIKLHIESVIRTLRDFTITYKIVNFTDVFIELENVFDLLILDLWDESSKSDKGSKVLMHNAEKQNIPTIIYTSAGDDLEFDLKSSKTKYHFLLDKLTKFSKTGEELINFLKGYIISTNGQLYYQVYNKNDKKLALAIKYIGESNFNYILYLFKTENKILENIIVYPMTSGWSGAVLFKLEISNDYFVLKLSKDIVNLKAELERSKNLYIKFPPHLIIPISPLEYFSLDKTVFGFSIKSVENSAPFLSIIVNKSNCTSAIGNQLSALYLQKDALKEQYRYKTHELGDWTKIFEKFDEGKLQWVGDAYIELKPIINKFYKKIDIDNFKRICLSHEFQNLNSSILLKKKYERALVLSHGDFHANNILIQSNSRPFIIDTGSLDYQFWSLDIARLLVSIFTLGLDKNEFDYFNLERIRYYLKIGAHVVKKRTFKYSNDDINLNTLYSINWLVNNLENIYETQFRLFEYQLGLFKEFLQVSYRVGTIPPSKRALALIMADICLKQANNSVLK